MLKFIVLFYSFIALLKYRQLMWWSDSYQITWKQHMTSWMLQSICSFTHNLSYCKEKLQLCKAYQGYILRERRHWCRGTKEIIFPPSHEGYHIHWYIWWQMVFPWPGLLKKGKYELTKKRVHRVSFVVAQAQGVYPKKHTWYFRPSCWQEVSYWSSTWWISERNLKGDRGKLAWRRVCEGFQRSCRCKCWIWLF